MSKRKRARLVYHQSYGKTNKEGYSIEIWNGERWGLDTFFPLLRRENADEDEENNFVHFSVLTKLHELDLQGYEITIL